MAQGPPVFRRSPRLVPELPRGEREIPPPPAAPTPPAPLIAALQSVGVSMMGAVLSAAVMFAIMRGRPGGGQTWLYALISLPAMVVTGLWNHFYQKSSYRKAAKQRQERYAMLLQQCHAEWDELWQQQRDALIQIDPSPSECLARIERRDSRIWERSPADQDFLTVRVGLGAVPFGISIKVPRQLNPLEPDPLFGQARKVADGLGSVQGGPIRVPLLLSGTTGLAGRRGEVQQAALTLALQIATHHSPDEVKIVAIFPAQEADHWAWMRWLPHVWTDDGSNRLLASDRDGAHKLLTSLYDALNRRKFQAALTSDSKAAQPLPYMVFFLADPSLVEREALLPLVLREGTALGAAAVILADRKEALPKECRTIIEVGPDSGQLIVTGVGTTQSAFVPDQADVTLAERAARALAPLRLQKMASPDHLPKVVTLLDLLGVTRVEEMDVLEQWRSSEPHRSLAAPLGVRSGGEQMVLDLHEEWHGPHGLVAGATGSGKSELLQTLIVSMADTYHPHHLVFVLVDFKGGALADDFKSLPHLVGTISNLSQGNLANRALAAIRGELRRRQSLLSEAGVNNINAYHLALRQGQQRPPLPHLVLIIDEFAELKQQLPDFMRELVSAVRVGRSLGIHLVLATQKPSGIVDEQIWGNTRFRLCLRVERPEDSMEVLKRPDAAGLTERGRAYCQVGNNELFELFQVAWSGAPYLPAAALESPPCEIAAVRLDGSRDRLYPRGEQRKSGQAQRKQLQAVVEHLGRVAEDAGIQRLAGPWLEPLPTAVSLDDLRPDEGWDGNRWRPVQSWLFPVVGMVDDPLNQYQGPLRINLGRDGHLGVYGAPGTGKTTFLQTMAVSLAMTHSPEDLHLYVLDFGGRTLTMLAALPHVGGVLVSDESERLNRLIYHLQRQMEVRKEKLSAAGVTTLPAYRAATGDSMPAIVVMLDNYAGLSSLYPELEDQLAQIAREGGNLGIHLVITANSPSAIRVRVATNITGAVALQLTDRGEYAAVGRTNGLEPMAAPGRGLAKTAPPLEFQTALPAPGQTEADRSSALRARLQEMSDAWRGPRPKPMVVLPETVPLSHVVRIEKGTVPAGKGPIAIGLEVESLEPLAVDLADGPHFLIAGPGQSGKSTLLHTWILSLTAAYPPDKLHLYLVDFRGESLAPFQQLQHVRGFITTDEQLQDALTHIAQTLRTRRQESEDARRDGRRKPEFPALVMVMEDFDALRDGLQSESKDLLEQIIRRDRNLGFHLLLAGGSGDLAACWDGWVKAFRELQTGFVIGSSEHGDLQLFNIRLAPSEAGKLLPAGQGYFARRGRVKSFKAANPSAQPDSLETWVRDVIYRGVGEP